MDKLRIVGGRGLKGRVSVAGAKNAALPALAATHLTEAPVTIGNLPAVRGVRTIVRKRSLRIATRVSAARSHALE